MSTSAWTHVICGPCYAQREPGRLPVQITDPPTETCCFCGGTTTAGIYYRADPATARCGGRHADDEDV